MTERKKTAITNAKAKPSRKSAAPKATQIMAAAQATAAPTEGPRGKIGAVIGLLRRPEGARVEDMMEATGWQAHSVRGAMSGALKKKLGLAVTSEKTDQGRVYRIAAEPAA